MHEAERALGDGRRARRAEEQPRRRPRHRVPEQAHLVEGGGRSWTVGGRSWEVIACPSRRTSRRVTSNQKQSEAIRSNQKQSGAIRSNQEQAHVEARGERAQGGVGLLQVVEDLRMKKGWGGEGRGRPCE